MKQIQQDIVQAIRQRKRFTSGNAKGSGYARREGLTGNRDYLGWDVMYGSGEFRYELWGNVIAKGSASTKSITVSTCGYNTPTTVSRLNAIFAGFEIPMAVTIRKEKAVYSLDGKEIIGVISGLCLQAGEWSVKIL